MKLNIITAKASKTKKICTIINFLAKKTSKVSRDDPKIWPDFEARS